MSAKNPILSIKEVVDAMAIETGWDKPSCKAAIEAFQKVTLDSCKAGNDVRLVGFCTFSNVFKPAHDATNPQNPTGPKIAVPDKNVFTVKAAKKVDMTPAAPAATARRRR